MIKSCNELIANCENCINFELNYSFHSPTCYSYIDWENIRNDGFDGIEFVKFDVVNLQIL